MIKLYLQIALISVITFSGTELFTNLNTLNQENNSHSKTKHVSNKLPNWKNDQPKIHKLNTLVNAYSAIATVIYKFAVQDYYGYGWDMTPSGATDTDFKTLWDLMYPNSNGNLNDPGTPSDPSILETALANLGPSANTLLANSFKDWQNVSIAASWNDLLKPDSTFYLNLNINNEKITNDAQTLNYFLTNSYYGYPFHENDPLFNSLITGSWNNPQNPYDETEILTKLKSRGPALKRFLTFYLNQPGIKPNNDASTMNAMLVKNSWLENELGAWNGTKYGFNKDEAFSDSTKLYNYFYTENYYYGYPLPDNSVDNEQISTLDGLIFQVGHGITSGEPLYDPTNTWATPLTKLTSVLGLKQWEWYSKVPTVFFKDPGSLNQTANLEDLKDGGGLATLLTYQEVSLNNDSQSLFNICNAQYLGFYFSIPNDSIQSQAHLIYEILFGFNNVISDWVINSQNTILLNLKKQKQNCFSLLTHFINSPGKIIAKGTDTNFLISNAWLGEMLKKNVEDAKLFVNQRINKFYTLLKSSYLGKFFTNNSFEGAQYILLLFNKNNENKLSLESTSELVSETFVNNLIITWDNDLTFHFLGMNDEKKALQITNYLDSLMKIAEDGSITLSGDLLNFAEYQKDPANIPDNPTSPESKLTFELILGIGISGGLIILAILISLYYRKIYLPNKSNKSIKK